MSDAEITARAFPQLRERLSEGRTEKEQHRAEPI
jgi:hypothetical protein